MLNLFRRHKALQLFGLVSPGALWILLFFNIPLLIVLFISFVERGRAGGIKLPPVYTLENYRQLFNACSSQFAGPECDPFLYISIFGHSVRIALIVTATGAFLFSVYLSALEQFVIHAWCRWCIGSAAIATLIFLFTLPEFRRLRRTA